MGLGIFIDMIGGEIIIKYLNRIIKVNDWNAETKDVSCIYSSGFNYQRHFPLFIKKSGTEIQNCCFKS